MSYRGRPSKGCEACRSRKVKCSEEKPICTRCIRSGHECRYRDPADLLFRNQTAAAAHRAEENWRKRSKSYTRVRSDSIVQFDAATNFEPSATQSRARSTSINKAPELPNTVAKPIEDHADVLMTQNTAEQDSFRLHIVPSIAPDMGRLAYERFVYDFVTPEHPNKSPDEPSESVWTFIPVLYRNTSPDSCLAMIVNAVSYVNFANRCNAPQMALLAEEYIGKGIKMLSRTIGNSQQAASDDALCSAYLMQIYDTVSSGQRNNCKAHQHGANALLHLRTVEQYYSNPISARLYELIFWQQLLSHLHQGKPPPIPVEDFLRVRQTLPSLYNDSNTLVIQLIWREAGLHARWEDLKQSPTPPTSRRDLHDLLQTAVTLDAQFQTWETTVPLAWRYQMQPNSPEARATYDMKWQQLVLGSRGAPEEIHAYSSLKRCWVWTFYRTSRMFLLRDILEMINWMFRLPEPEEALQHTFTASSPPLQQQTDTANDSSTLPLNLDNLTLHIQHAFTTVHMVNIIEKSCSAVLGSFTVPIHGKSVSDVVGMRGYVVFWSLGIMDSVLSSGLVPDCNAPASPPDSACSSPQTQARGLGDGVGAGAGTGAGSSTTTMHNNNPHPPPAPSSSPQQQHQHQPPLPSSSSPQPKPHPFNASPPHPFSLPITNLPTLDYSITKRKSIDVAARRVWLNSMLYYIGSELGIKKALAVPYLQGYWGVVKPVVDSVVGGW